MSRIPFLAIAAIALSASAASQATEYSLGASVGSSHYRFGSDSGIDQDVGSILDTGFKVFGTADFTRNFGLELGYVNLGSVKFDDHVDGMSGSIKGDGFYLDLVGTAPIVPRFDLFGKLGVFDGHVNATLQNLGSGGDSGTDAAFGLGGAYHFNKNTSLRLEWERFRFNVTGGTFDTDLYSVGVTYKFQ